MDQTEQPTVDFASITAEIVSSFVANNSVHRAELAGVIASVHAALQGLVAPKQAEPEKQQPAVSIRKSVTQDFLISLEDGKPYRTLKRHLSKLGLTPDDYRTKWDLPRDYPMVAPSYTQKRAELARKAGLGQKRRTTAGAKAVAPETVVGPAEVAQPKRRAPAKKAKAAE
jgi:predicted transcriptional regulator